MSGIVAEGGKKKGPRSLISRARSRSVNSHQGAFEPTLVPTSFVRRNRSPHVDSYKEASVRQSRYPSRSGTTRVAVDICDEASGASGTTNLGPPFASRKWVAKIFFSVLGGAKTTYCYGRPSLMESIRCSEETELCARSSIASRSYFRVRYAAQPISQT